MNNHLQSGNAAVEKDIVDNLSSFISHHDVKGGKSKELQNAIDAVIVACVFSSKDDSSSVSNRIVADRIGVHRNKLALCQEWGHVNDALAYNNKQQIK